MHDFEALAALESLADQSPYLRQVSPLLADGVTNVHTRWREHQLTPYDGLLGTPEALQLLRERFGLEKLIISTTSLEDFFGCPFYYFQKHVLGIVPWEEPEAALSINALDLGSLSFDPGRLLQVTCARRCRGRRKTFP